MVFHLCFQYLWPRNTCLSFCGGVGFWRDRKGALSEPSGVCSDSPPGWDFHLSLCHLYAPKYEVSTTRRFLWKRGLPWSPHFLYCLTMGFSDPERVHTAFSCLFLTCIMGISEIFFSVCHRHHPTTGRCHPTLDLAIAKLLPIPSPPLVSFPHFREHHLIRWLPASGSALSPNWPS